MLKKLLLFTLAAFALTACNDDKDDTGLPKGYRYATENTSIENGFLIGKNMHFYGTSSVTDTKGGIFVDDKAYFEFAGGAEQLTIYMHTTRFASGMPAVEMRIPKLDYTGKDNSIAFETASIVPEALVAATGAYTPMPRYTITGLDGSIDNTLCKVNFTCMGFQVKFEGKLIVQK